MLVKYTMRYVVEFKMRLVVLCETVLGKTAKVTKVYDIASYAFLIMILKILCLKATIRIR